MHLNEETRYSVNSDLFQIDKFTLGYSGRTLRDFLEALPREWISEDLMEALVNRGLHLSPTM